MESCIFCKIARGEIPAKIALERETVVAFHDIQPRAPIHILVVPRRHTESPTELDSRELAAVFNAVGEIARKFDLADGYRIVINSGPHAGQQVPHVHFHILAGRKLSAMG
ncbi:MAG: histidine triad nucleotide-binding protein [Bacillota bacterium]